jgi:cation:H+ antiporter
MTLLYFLIGLAFLIIGAELLVRGASKIAGALGISPLIIGLTVVALGTSSPELAISISSSLSGQADVALGNVIGSNIFNVLFILGLSAIIIPLTVSQQLIRFDVPLLIVLSIAVLGLSIDLILSPIDGLILVIVLIGYITTLAWFSLRDRPSPTAKGEDQAPESHQKQMANGWLHGILVIIGLAMLIFGSRWFVDSTVQFAGYLGVSELVISLTVVAAGTSMPEVVTSVIAAFRGERDIAVGNVVGSNIFNILAVLGITTVISPSGIAVSEAIIGFDLPLMIAVAIACLPIFFTKGTINRWEGALFLGYYLAYTIYLILNATQHDLLPLFSTTMLYFIMPLTMVTIVVVVIQEVWGKRSEV